MRALRQPPRTPAWPCVLAAGLTVAACFQDQGSATTTPAASAADTSTTSPVTTSTTDPTSSTTSTTSTTSTALDPDSTTTSTTADTSTTEPTTGACLDLWYIDIDGDGYGGPESEEGCGPPPPGFTVDSLDCDDTRPKIFPGAEELCDKLDNDCDSGVDEWPAAQSGPCGGCEAQLQGDHYYYFCATELSWQAARDRCHNLLADLVVVDTAAEHLYLGSVVKPLQGKWWLGLSDLDLESTFVWVDGAALDPRVKFWGKGEPDDAAVDAPGSADCVVLSADAVPSDWRDQVCTSPRPFICEAAGA